MALVRTLALHEDLQHLGPPGASAEFDGTSWTASYRLRMTGVMLGPGRICPGFRVSELNYELVEKDASRSCCSESGRHESAGRLGSSRFSISPPRARMSLSALRRRALRVYRPEPVLVRSDPRRLRMPPR